MERTKVLLVDDEVEFVTALSERLQLRDYDARAVHSAEDAFSAVRTDPPDVVLLDLKMPGTDGIEVLKNIKRHHPRMQVIILTGLGMGSEQDEVARCGAFDYVMKPVDIEDLVLKIDQAKKEQEQG